MRGLRPVTADPGRRRRSVEGPAGRLELEEAGEGGLPVVFVPSLAGNAGHWSAFVDGLGAERRAVALELRGHGGSAPPADGDYRIGAYAADLAAACDALGLDRFVLTGHSMGASVAAAYAAAHPDRVAGLMLVDGAHAAEEPAPEEEAWLIALRTDEYPKLIEDFWRTILRGSKPAVRERVLGDLRATPRETVVESFHELVRHDPVQHLRRYHGQIALVLSDIGDGPSAAHHHVEGVASTLIEGTGHWLQLDRPEAFGRALEDFVATVP